MTTEGLNKLRDECLRIAKEHGFNESSIGEDVALFHSEASELLEDHRESKGPTEVWYEEKRTVEYEGETYTIAKRFQTMSDPAIEHPRKPCGISSECADIIIRVLHFCGKHGIDIEGAVREKVTYNESRPYKHGKIL